jgi:hypothetical protein
MVAVASSAVVTLGGAAESLGTEYRRQFLPRLLLFAIPR